MWCLFCILTMGEVFSEKIQILLNLSWYQIVCWIHSEVTVTCFRTDFGISGASLDSRHISIDLHSDLTYSILNWPQLVRRAAALIWKWRNRNDVASILVFLLCLLTKFRIKTYLWIRDWIEWLKIKETKTVYNLWVKLVGDIISPSSTTSSVCATSVTPPNTRNPRGGGGENLKTRGS